MMYSKSRLARPPTPAPVAPKMSPAAMAWLTMGLSVLQTIVVAVFGYILKDRLDLALKERQTSVQERQATVQALEKMAKLLTDINAPSVDEDTRSRTILQVAMYGSDAIYPLFVMAASRNAYPPGAAIAGLRLLAVQHHAHVCTLLTDALQVPKAINEIRRKSIEELTAELGCVNLVQPR